MEWAGMGCEGRAARPRRSAEAEGLPGTSTSPAREACFVLICCGSFFFFFFFFLSLLSFLTRLLTTIGRLPLTTAGRENGR